MLFGIGNVGDETQTCDPDIASGVLKLFYISLGQKGRDHYSLWLRAMEQSRLGEICNFKLTHV